MTEERRQELEGQITQFHANIEAATANYEALKEQCSVEEALAAENAAKCEPLMKQIDEVM